MVAPCLTAPFQLCVSLPLTTLGNLGVESGIICALGLVCGIRQDLFLLQANVCHSRQQNHI